MFKQLIVAYTGEGSTDEIFLGAIIRRTLDDISLRHGNSFELIQLVWLGPAKGDTTIARIKVAFDEGVQLLVIHRDTDQYDAETTKRMHFRQLFARTAENILSQMPIVPLIIRHEQETWYFADLEALSTACNGRVKTSELGLPPNIENRANTKELFKQVIRRANQDQTRGRGIRELDVIENLSEGIRLSKLERLPSYSNFVEDLETALQAIGYIQSKG